MKQVQINNKKYDLPEEDVKIYKLIQKGVGLDSKIREMQSQMQELQHELIAIARKRRGESTSVKLTPLLNETTAVITFRESYECKEKIDTHEIVRMIGNLFDRFFVQKTVIKTTKELRSFITGKVDYDLPDADKLRSYLQKVVTKKETKPSVRFEI